MKEKKCQDCKVSPDKIHKSNCDVETCPLCGLQLLTCGCDLTRVSDNDRIPWSGETHGCKDCREYDLWATFVKGRGWIPCDKRERGATEDLNTLMSSPDFEWNQKEKRWMKKDEH